jgi:hypothetical protein
MLTVAGAVLRRSSLPKWQPEKLLYKIVDLVHSGGRMTEQWLVEFIGAAGAQARAVLKSEDQARAFAEQLAQSMLPVHRTPLLWSNVDGVALLSTALGNYRVQQVTE